MRAQREEVFQLLPSPYYLSHHNRWPWRDTTPTHDLAKNHRDIIQLQSWTVQKGDGKRAEPQARKQGWGLAPGPLTAAVTRKHGPVTVLLQTLQPRAGAASWLVFSEHWGFKRRTEVLDLVGVNVELLLHRRRLTFRLPGPGPVQSLPALRPPGRQRPHCPQGSGPGTVPGWSR